MFSSIFRVNTPTKSSLRPISTTNARGGAQGGRSARGGARDGQVTNTTGIVNAMESVGPRAGGTGNGFAEHTGDTQSSIIVDTSVLSDHESLAGLDLTGMD